MGHELVPLIILLLLEKGGMIHVCQTAPLGLGDFEVVTGGHMHLFILDTNSKIMRKVNHKARLNLLT